MGQADRPVSCPANSRRSCRTGITASSPSEAIPSLATLGWLFGAYSFDRYRKRPAKAARARAAGVDADEIARIAHAVAASRDLINTPTNDLGPDGIEAAARHLADRHGASFSSIVGDQLLKQNFPMIHAVGRASTTEPPRLIDFTWGTGRCSQGHPGRQGRGFRYRRPRHQAEFARCSS